MLYFSYNPIVGRCIIPVHTDGNSWIEHNSLEREDEADATTYVTNFDLGMIEAPISRYLVAL